MIRSPPRSPLFPYPPFSRSLKSRQPFWQMPLSLLPDRQVFEGQTHFRNGKLQRIDLSLNRSAAAGKVTKIGRATSELQSQSNLVCRLLLEKKKTTRSLHDLH